jgi:hypothetical protein
MSLILWSGGLDSTLALYRELVGAGAGSAWNVGVGASELDRRYAHRMLSLDAGTAFAGQRWLPRARTRIAKALRAAGLDFDQRTVTLDAGGAGPWPGEGGSSPQGPTWIALGSLFARHDEDVVLSFLRGECDRLDALREAFDRLQHASGKTGKLRTPLAGYTKADVLHELSRVRVPGLVDAAWWCEEPFYAHDRAALPDGDRRAHEAAMERYRRGKPCGMCVKCEEIAAARWRLDNQRRFHDRTGAG